MSPQNQQPEQQSTLQPQSLLSKLNWKYVGIGLVVILVVGVGAFWVGRKTVNNLSQIPITLNIQPIKTPSNNYLQDELYCEKNEDCTIQHYCSGMSKCNTPVNINKLINWFCNNPNEPTRNPTIKCSEYEDYALCINNQCTLVKSDTQDSQSTIITEESANWKTYENNDLVFRYPVDWIEENGQIYSPDRNTRIIPVPKEATLMNECHINIKVLTLKLKQFLTKS